VEYFDYGVENLNTGFDVGEFLEKSQQHQEQRLEQQLERIKSQLEERDRIFEENRDELESKLDWYLDRLQEEYNSVGPESVDELKGKIEEFYELMREEKRKHWRDRQELEQEWRELRGELDELEDTRVDDIIDSLCNPI
jgi:trichohyalin